MKTLAQLFLTFLFIGIFYAIIYNSNDHTPYNTVAMYLGYFAIGDIFAKVSRLIIR
jgi:hypothetical protein